MVPDGLGDGADRRPARLTWAFVALGVLLRLGRMALDFPLWWDEAFVGVNFLHRGYRDLLRPLDYGQVCPPLFLWAEKAAVEVFGFSATSLRLVPLACAVGSVFLFRHASGRVLKGWPWALATAIFAVAYHPIRHATDAKPYASDLFVATALLALALEWRHDPSRPRWLWALAAAAPFALAMSYPAAFVAGGIALALFVPVTKADRRDTRLAFGAFLLATVGSFAGLYVAVTRGQAAATLPAMQPDWSGAFPPLGSPWALVRWLVSVHAGSLMAYPCGDDRGASSLTLLAVLVGAGVLRRRGGRSILALCLGPLAVALVAAALRRYPYGGGAVAGAARVTQYAAPGLCLLAGLGAATLVGRLRRRRLALAISLVGLVAVGVVPLALEAGHPYRSVHSQRSRAFARLFWPEMAQGAEVACLRQDFGVGGWDSIHLGRPVALCNRAIYAPSLRPRWDAVSASHPLRCVLADAHPDDDRAVAAWLDSMRDRFELRDRRTVVANMAEPGAPKRLERYEVFEFIPNTAPGVGTAERPTPTRR